MGSLPLRGAAFVMIGCRKVVFLEELPLCRLASPLREEGVGRRLILGEFPLRGAARLGEERYDVYSDDGRLPLRGAARLREGGG